MAKQKFERTKPHVNIGTIGHVDHGKTTTTAAITALLRAMGKAQARKFDEIDNAPEEKERGITINTSHVEYETDTSLCARGLPRSRRLREEHDHRRRSDGRCDLGGECGGWPDASDPGAHPIARQVGVPSLVVWLNKADMVDDEELMELVEMEVRELLSEYEFPGDEIPVLSGSSLKVLEELEKGEMGEWSARLQKLMDAVDEYIPTPVREVDKPFLMPVEDVFTITGRGTVATGRVERGVIKVGDEVEIIGIRDTQKTVATGVEMFRKLLDQAEAGDNIGVLLRGIDREEIERGQVLAKPGTIKPYTQFEGEVYILSKEEGGRHTPFFDGYRPQFYFRTTDVTGVVKLPEGTEMVMPGDNIRITAELISPIAMEEGLALCYS